MYDQNVQRIISDLVQNYKPIKVILFGSRVTGKTHEDSDVDLVVIKQTNKNFYDRIADASGSVDHVLPIDIIVYTPEEFKQMSKESWFIKSEVINKGKVIYG